MGPTTCPAIKYIRCIVKLAKLLFFFLHFAFRFSPRLQVCLGCDVIVEALIVEPMDGLGVDKIPVKEAISIRFGLSEASAKKVGAIDK